MDPVRSVLDRVLVSSEWDTLFPRSSLIAESHIGSDHTPLLLDSGDGSGAIVHNFRFDSSWLLIDGFIPLVSDKIMAMLLSPHRSFVPIDD